MREKLERLTCGATARTLRGRDPYDARLPSRAGYWAGMKKGATAAAMRSILREHFGIDSVKGYQMHVNLQVVKQWRGDDDKVIGRSDIRATRMIAEACSHGDGPRVFVAGGWYDLVVRFATARRHAKEGAFGACDIELHDYPAGHMIYVDKKAHAMLTTDIRAWLEAGDR